MRIPKPPIIPIAIPGLNNFTIEGRRSGSLLTPDPQRTWLWEMIIPTIMPLAIDLGGLSTFNPRALLQTVIPTIDDDLTIRCRSIAIPGSGFEFYESNFMGFKQKFPIKVKYTNTVTTEFEEFEDQIILKLLYCWKNKIIQQNAHAMPPENMGGDGKMKFQDKMAYKRSITLNLYSFDGWKLQKSIVMVNAWPENVNEVNLTYDSSNSVKYSVDWGFDFWKLQ